MKIVNPSSSTITGICPKVIETNYGMILNTQYYTKEKMAPVPFESIFCNGTPYALSIRKQLYLQSYSWAFANEECNIVKDSKYENRYYMRTLEGYISGTWYSRIVAFEETNNGEVKILGSWSARDIQIHKIIDQNDDYLYFTARSGGSYYLYRMNKKTFGVDNQWSSSTSYHYLYIEHLHSDDMYIYLMFISDHYVYAARYNKHTNSYEYPKKILTGEEDTSAPTWVNYYYSSVPDDVHKIDEHTYGLFYYNPLNKEQPLDLYLYDITKTFDEGFTMQHYTINWGHGKDKIDFVESTQDIVFRNFTTEFNGVKYLNLFVYKQNFNSVPFIQHQGIYTFVLDHQSHTLTFTGYNQIDGAKQIHGFIYDESRRHIIVAKQNAFQILKFDINTQRYEKTNFEITNCYSAGLDELQRLWYIKTDTSVHMVNLEDAQSVEIKFENEYYDYTGTSINTYITFSALNYLDEDFPGIFELSIEGPAVFSENNNSVLQFNYNGNGPQQIGVTITGASPITIYPKFIS